MIGFGFDSVEETFNLFLKEPFIAQIQAAKEAAEKAERDDVALVEIGGERFHVASHGGQAGVRYIFKNDDLIIRCRSPKAPWPLSVRYTAAGLWEYGIAGLRDRVGRLLTTVQDGGRIEATVKRVDWCCDFYSPALTEKMNWSLIAGGTVLAPSGVTHRCYGSGERLETVTIGSKASLQIEMYDKGKEISDVSGKTWMFDCWRLQGWAGPDATGRARDVWRLEVRMFKNWLRERGVNTFEDAERELSRLVGEALYAYRLTVRNPRDKNRARWPMHPVWWLAADQVDACEMSPMGRRYTLRKYALIQNFDAQIIGTARAREVLAHDDFSKNDVERVTARVGRGLFSAAENRGAVAELRERYRFVSEAR